MIIEIINTIIGFALVVFAGYFAYMSSIMVSEKKELYRRGLVDYYGNPIQPNVPKASPKQSKATNAERSIFDKSKVKYCDGDNT